MTKYICDMCKEREASQEYIVRKRKKNIWRAQNGWVEIDICFACAGKLMDTATRKAAGE
ncbi:MAG: hypothetical protein ACRC3H_02590 [Lachnospiraceae bacterium]